MNNSPEQTSFTPKQIAILLFSVFIIAFCGILYELLIGTLSTYFLGSSVLHFSITIGLFMTFMGVGSWISKYLQEPVLDKFIWIEWGLGMIGGFCALLLYATFSLTENFYLISFFCVAIIGTGIGLEIPLIARLIQKNFQFKDTIAQVLSFDYIGALVASLAFPLLLLPYFGTVKTGFLIGILNMGIAILNLEIFHEHLVNYKKLKLFSYLGSLILLIGFLLSFQMVTFLEEFLYRDPVVYVEQSPYQRIVLTQWKQDVRLFLNGNLQFSTVDEYRYHEPLVHVPMLSSKHKEKVLILGAGDGLAVREILKYPTVKEIHLVDLDPAMTNLGKNHWLLKKINKDALNSPKVKIFNQDAWEFINKSNDIYDVIIADLPDPNDTGLGKLYTKEFFELAKKRLSAMGTFCTQSTSPYFALRSFWCIHTTLDSVFNSCFPYHAYVPSFGDWGFNVAFPYKISKEKWIENVQSAIKQVDFHFQFLDKEEIVGLFFMGKDCEKVEVPIQTLEKQVLVEMYEQEWKQWHD